MKQTKIYRDQQRKSFHETSDEDIADRHQQRPHSMFEAHDVLKTKLHENKSQLVKQSLYESLQKDPSSQSALEAYSESANLMLFACH